MFIAKTRLKLCAPEERYVAWHISLLRSEEPVQRLGL